MAQSKWDILWSSAKEDWETPQVLFDELDAEFHFTLDAAANEHNAKCANFYSWGSLHRPWEGVVWCNPPYSTKVGEWVNKGYESSLSGATVVMLLYARTDTRWFHEFIYGKAEIRFIKGRVKFVGSQNSAPAPSMVVIWKPGVDHGSSTSKTKTDTRQA